MIDNQDSSQQQTPPMEYSVAPAAAAAAAAAAAPASTEPPGLTYSRSSSFDNGPVTAPAVATAADGTNPSAEAATNTAAQQQPPDVRGMNVKETKGRFRVLQNSENSSEPKQSISQQSTPQPTPVVVERKGRFSVLHQQEPARERTSSSGSVDLNAVASGISSTPPPVSQKKGRFVVTNTGATSAEDSRAATSGVPPAQTQPPINSSNPLVGSVPTAMVAEDGRIAVVQPPPQVDGQPPMNSAAPGHQMMGATQMAPTNAVVQPPPQQQMVYMTGNEVQAQQQPVMNNPNTAISQTPINSAPAAAVPQSKSALEATSKPPRGTPRQTVRSTVTASGLGKVFHFLEQMRTEVTSADKTIKSLQSDSKFLKERNKELEAKLRETERKFSEEKALREAAEAKIKALRKRLKGLKAEEDVVVELDNSIPNINRTPSTESNNPPPPPPQDSSGEHTETINVVTSVSIGTTPGRSPVSSRKLPSPQQPGGKKVRQAQPQPSLAGTSIRQPQGMAEDAYPIPSGIKPSRSGEFSASAQSHASDTSQAQQSMFPAMGQVNSMSMSTSEGEMVSLNQPLLQMSPAQTLSSASSFQDAHASGGFPEIQQPLFSHSQQRHDSDGSFPSQSLLPNHSVNQLSTTKSMPDIFSSNDGHPASGQPQNMLQMSASSVPFSIPVSNVAQQAAASARQNGPFSDAGQRTGNSSTG